MKIERKWAMPNKWTFTIKPIRELLEDEGCNQGMWCDPFAGKNSPAEMTNDLNPDIRAKYHTDALTFLRQLKTGVYTGVLFDPPYSITQAAQCYRDFGTDKLKTSVANMGYWKQVKDEIARVLKPKGKVICFGWSSMGLGKGRGFEMQRILLVPHGGSKNDTIVTVETKI
jgi:hypothetical protein